MNRFFTFGWFLSAIGFLIVLFGTYAETSERLDLALQPGSFLSLSKHAYFYLSVGLFTVFASLVFLLAKLLPQLPERYFSVPQKEFWFAGWEARSTFNSILKGWVMGVGASINVVLMVVIREVGINNHIDGYPQFMEPWWFIAGIILFSVCIISMPVRLMFARRHLFTDRRQ